MDLPVNYNEIHHTKRRIVREKYIELQNGNCCHCGASLKSKASDEMLAKPIDRSLFPPNFFKWPVHLHHDHYTGLTIGAVHNYCNAVLWQHHGE